MKVLYASLLFSFFLFLFKKSKFLLILDLQIFFVFSPIFPILRMLKSNMVRVSNIEVSAVWTWNNSSESKVQTSWCSNSSVSYKISQSTHPYCGHLGYTAEVRNSSTTCCSNVMLAGRRIKLASREKYL